MNKNKNSDEKEKKVKPFLMLWLSILLKRFYLLDAEILLTHNFLLF